MLFTKRRKIIKESVKHDFSPPRNKYIIIPDRKILLVLFVSLCVLGTWLFLRSPFFTIENVLIDGISCNEKDSAGEALCKTAYSFKGKNLVFLSEKGVSGKLLSSYYLISSVKVNKRYPKDIIFSFEVRVPIAVLRNLPNLSINLATESGVATDSVGESSPSAGFFVDKDGIVLGEAQSFSLKLPTLFSSYSDNFSQGKKFGGKIEGRALYLLSKLSGSEFLVKDLSIYDNIFLVKMSKGGEIVFSADKDVDLQVASLQVTLHTLTIDGRRYKRIDLRFEKPIVQ